MTRKNIFLITYISTWILVMITPVEFYYFKESTLKWILGVVVSFIQFYSLYKLLSSTKLKRKTKRQLTALIAYISIFLFFLSLKLRVNQSLEQTGVTSYAKVEKVWLRERVPLKSPTVWMANISFKVKDKVYHTTRRTPNKKYKIGDSLQVIFNSTSPSICTFPELNKE